MRLPTRLSLAAIVGVLATAAACSDSSTSPPPPPAPGTLAQHFDTLYQRAKASSVSDTNFNFRAQILSDLELGAAYGAPTTITVTTSTGTEQWKGFVVEEVMNNNGTPSDSFYFVAAYRDSLVHTALISEVLGSGVLIGSRLLANDTLQLAQTSGGPTISPVSAGGACGTPIAGLVNPIITSAASATCTSASFHAALNVGFPATTNVDAALTELSFSTTTFAGVRLFDPPTSGGQARLASLLRSPFEAVH